MIRADSAMRWALPLARRLCAGRSVILGGHGIGALPEALDPHHLTVASTRFRAQVELLLAAGFQFVTVGELAERTTTAASTSGLAALSFDDGMEDNVSVLLPLLREYGLPATVYVVTGLIGRPNPWLDPRSRARMMTSDELSELVAAGVELGAHTVTHADLSALDHEACRREVETSRAVLRDLTGAAVETFAYPFCRHSPGAVRAVRAAGFSAAVSGEGHGNGAPYTLERAMITGVDGTASFLAKLFGTYEPLRASRAGSLARAASRRPRRFVRAVREPRTREF